MKTSFFSKSNIPNIITIFRITLVPLILILLVIPNSLIVYTINFSINNTPHHISISLLNLIASIIFIIASLSDFFDGFLSRKWNVVSTFGKFWDPLADKILTNTVLFCLSSQSLIPIWLPIILLIRDLLIDGFRLYSIKNNIVISANIYGKIKTFILMIAIIYVFFFGDTITNTGTLYYWLIQNFLIYVATIFSIISAIIYIYPFLSKFSSNKSKS